MSSAPKGTSIATLGTDNFFVSLHFRRLGSLIELVAEATNYSPTTGRYDYEELCRQVTDDEDDAVNVAVDFEYEARDYLSIYDAGEQITLQPKGTRGFGEALEAEFNKARAHHAIAAE